MFAGQCICGAVHYQSPAEPVFAGNCYCRDCRNESGTGHITAVAVPDPTLTVTGKLSEFTRVADSGKTITKFFCPVCGSTLFTRAEGVPGLALLRAGTLDDPTPVAPQMNLYASSAPAWDKADPALPGFAGMPPM